MSDTFLIWSIEHNAWWRPASCGYTQVLAEAGRYDRDEANQILRQANIIRTNECKIPVECASLDEQLARLNALIENAINRLEG